MPMFICMAVFDFRFFICQLKHKINRKTICITSSCSILFYFGVILLAQLMQAIDILLDLGCILLGNIFSAKVSKCVQCNK